MSITLEEAVAQVERDFTVGGSSRPLALTGERYVEICSGYDIDHIRSHCKQVAAFFTTEAAVRDWLSRFSEYADGKSGTLYWSIRPELVSIEHGWTHWLSRFDTDTKTSSYEDVPHFKVYSRLLISDNPVLPAEDMAILLDEISHRVVDVVYL